MAFIEIYAIKVSGNIWFQQDGATYHTAEATLDVLRPVSEDRNCENIKYFVFKYFQKKKRFLADPI